MLASSPTPTQPVQPLLCPPVLQLREGEREVEKALTLSQGPRTPDLCAQHITPMVFRGKGVTSLSQEVCKQD